MQPRSLALIAAMLLAPVLAAAEKPAGWVLAGSEPSSYTMEKDLSVTHEAKASGRLASIGQPKGFGTMMQTFDASAYRGKRLKYSAFVKASKVGDWAGLWMRVDGPEQHKTLAFDNMQNRPIKGTKDWAQYAVVLDVPEDAFDIAFGILLGGTGTVWLDNVEFQVVDKSVPTTSGATISKQPENLNFER